MSKADEILKLLEERRNALISGPPGTGKSMLSAKSPPFLRAMAAPRVTVPAAQSLFHLRQLLACPAVSGKPRTGRCFGACYINPVSTVIS